MFATLTGQAVELQLTEDAEAIAVLVAEYERENKSTIPVGVDLRMKACSRAELAFCAFKSPLALVKCVHKDIRNGYGVGKRDT